MVLKETVPNQFSKLTVIFSFFFSWFSSGISSLSSSGSSVSSNSSFSTIGCLALALAPFALSWLMYVTPNKTNTSKTIAKIVYPKILRNTIEDKFIF